MIDKDEVAFTINRSYAHIGNVSEYVGSYALLNVMKDELTYKNVHHIISSIIISGEHYVF